MKYFLVLCALSFFVFGSVAQAQSFSFEDVQRFHEQHGGDDLLGELRDSNCLPHDSDMEFFMVQSQSMQMRIDKKVKPMCQAGKSDKANGYHARSWEAFYKDMSSKMGIDIGPHCQELMKAYQRQTLEVARGQLEELGAMMPGLFNLPEPEDSDDVCVFYAYQAELERNLQQMTQGMMQNMPYMP